MRTATVDRRAYSRRFWDGKTRFSQAVRRTLEELERQKGQTKTDDEERKDARSLKKAEAERFSRRWHGQTGDTS